MVKRMTTKATHFEWPVHAPKVALAQTYRLIAESDDMRAKTLLATLGRLEDPQHSDESFKSWLIHEDIHTLLESDLIEAAQDDAVNAIAFSVDEAEKRRRRFILWPKMLNTLHLPSCGANRGSTAVPEYKAEMPLRNMSQFIHDLTVALEGISNPRAITIDLKAAFFQTPIPISLRKYTVFQTDDGTKYRMTRMPMGWSMAPEIQQRRGGCLLKGINTPFVNLHVDDYLFVTEADKLVTTAKAFFEKAAKYNITVGSHTAGTTVKSIGLMVNVGDREISLADSFRNKLLADEPKPKIQVGEFVQAMGRLVHGTLALDVDPASFYYLFKQFRNISRKVAIVGWHEYRQKEIPLWSASLSQWEQWRQKILNAPPRRLVRHRGKLGVLYTDASDWGFGAILIVPGQAPLLMQHSWMVVRFWKNTDYLPSINQRELFAVIFASQWAEEQGWPPSSLKLYVDNKTAIAAITRGYSAAFWLNEMLRLWSNLRREDMGRVRFHSVEWIPSVANIADKPSRGLLHTL